MRSTFLVILFLFAFNLQADERLKANNTFHINFPKLHITSKDKEAKMGIYLPKDYTLDRKFPLVVLFTGGYGGNNPKFAQNVTQGLGYICIALPYKKEVEPAKGLWSTPWEYYETMLNKATELIPNIDPERRVCIGNSSGGAAILYSIGASKKFRDYFCAFMPGLAGWDMGGLDKLGKKPMMIYMGDQDERFSGYQSLYKRCQEENVNCKFLIFKGVGHNVPRKFYLDLKAWMDKHVLLKGFDRIKGELQAFLNQRQWTSANKSLNKILLMLPNNHEERKSLKTHQDLLNKACTAQAEKILSAPKLSAKLMRKFIRAWDFHPATKALQEKSNEMANEQLTKINSQTSTQLKNLSLFLKLWEGFPVFETALIDYQKLVEPQFSKIQSLSSLDKKYKYAQFLKKKYPYAYEQIKVANKFVDESLSKVLEKVKRMKNPQQKKAKLLSFAKTFKESPVATQAQNLADSL